VAGELQGARPPEEPPPRTTTITPSHDGQRETSAAAPTTAQPVTCATLRGRTLLGMRVQHLQFTNSFTRARVWDALHWLDGAAAHRRSEGGTGEGVGGEGGEGREGGEGGEALACGVALPELARRLPSTSQHGVMIGSAVADYSLFCVSVPPSTNLTVRCPCCWVAPAHAARETTRCPAWNPNL
jgi:hypothetical protein